MKRFSLAVVMTLMLLAQAVPAAAEWYTCTVEKVGVITTNNIVFLTDSAGAFTNSYRTISADYAKNMLPILTIAVTTGQKVMALTTPGEGGAVLAVYLMKE